MVNYRDSDSAIYYCDSSSATYGEVLTGNFGGSKYMDTLIFRLYYQLTHIESETCTCNQWD